MKACKYQKKDSEFFYNLEVGNRAGSSWGSGSKDFEDENEAEKDPQDLAMPRHGGIKCMNQETADNERGKGVGHM